MTLFSRVWLKAAPKIDAHGGREHRERLLAGLSGTVVEVGAGAGLTFPLYPEAVTRIVALEPDALLRDEAAKTSDPRVEVLDGVAERLPLGDGEADAVVFALVLCTVPDQAVALAEARRVLKPGGELRFWEHVIAERGVRRPILKGLDRSGVWPALAGGCHPARDTRRAIEAAGFRVGDFEAFDFRMTPLSPPLPFIRGVAAA